MFCRSFWGWFQGWCWRCWLCWTIRSGKSKISNFLFGSHCWWWLHFRFERAYSSLRAQTIKGSSLYSNIALRQSIQLSKFGITGFLHIHVMSNWVTCVLTLETTKPDSNVRGQRRSTLQYFPNCYTLKLKDLWRHFWHFYFLVRWYKTTQAQKCGRKVRAQFYAEYAL